MIVRAATPDDLPWLHAQCRAFSDFFGSAWPLYGDQAHVDATLRLLMAEHLVLVAERAGELLGLIAGMFTPHLMNPAILTLCELLWWTPPEHRGNKAASLLLDAFIAAGRERAAWITFSLNERTPVSKRSIVRRGFQPCEQTFLLEVAV